MMPSYLLNNEPISLEEFLDANEDLVFLSDILRGLQPGEKLFFGGGAEPESVFERAKETP